jgi:hypothetical protein
VTRYTGSLEPAFERRRRDTRDSIGLLFAGNGVFFADGQSAGMGTPIWWFRFETGRPIQVSVIHEPLVVLTPSLSVTGDGRWIAWSQIDHQQSNLMLVDNFR